MIQLEMNRMSVEGLFSAKYNSFKESLTVLSRSDKEKPESSLVHIDDFFAYDFDKITSLLWGEDPLTSADALFVKQNKVYLIEFKTGFSSILEESDIDDSKLICEKMEKPSVCEDYKKCLKEKNDFKKEALYYSIKLKVVESYKTILCKIFPNEILRENVDLIFLCVIDGKNVAIEKYQSDIDELTKVSSDNHVNRLKKSIKRYRSKMHWYDSIEVYTAKDFENNFISS